jgi:hypothetical protein
MTGVATKVTLEGNFFKRDPKKTLRKNVRNMVEALAEELDDLVQGQIEARAGSMPFSTGWSAKHTVGRAESLTGNDWGTWAVASANTQGMDAGDAKRTLAAASSIEGRFHPYRNARSAVYRSRALLTADLTKDMN